MKTTRNSKGQFKKGLVPWITGRKMSEESKEKMRQAKLRNPTRYWKGKTRTDLGGTVRKRADGYMYVAWSLVEVELQKFFRKTIHRRPVVQHHYVWIKHNKKGVPKGFVIHHINERKDDNRIENLKLMKSGTHSSYHSSKQQEARRSK